MMPLTIPNLVAFTVQSALLVLVGAPLPRLLGIRSPGARLAYWHALLVACILLPFVQPFVPEPVRPSAALSAVTDAVVVGPAQRVAIAGSARVGWFPSIDAPGIVGAGIALRGAWLVLALAGLSRLRRGARRLDPRPASIDDAARLTGADAEFKASAKETCPATFGLLRPVVIVPVDFARFTEDEQRAIACHELTHVRRHDWLHHLIDEVLRTVAWFHPALWWLTRQLRLCREQVVDQEVVRRVGARKPYLDALIRLASPDRGAVLVPAPLFLGRTHLSDRIALLLKEVRMSRPRLVLSFVVMAVVLVVSGRAIVGAFPLHSEDVALEVGHAKVGQQVPGAARPGQAAPAPGIPKPTVEWRRTQGARPVFPPDAPDTPLLVSAEVDASGGVVNAATVWGPADMGVVAVDAVRQWRFSTPVPAGTLLFGFNPAAAPTAESGPKPLKVGGNIRPPIKIRDSKPVFPKEAQDARIQGIVIIEAAIASDGAVAEGRILRSIPELDAAALTAVLGWKFTPTLMNGVPVDVVMTVTVNFTLKSGPGAKGGVPGSVSGGVGSGVGSGVGGGESKSAFVDLPSGKRAFRVKDDIKPPVKVVDVLPVYPQDARDAGVQGIVIVEAVIGPDGKVQDAKVVRAVPTLDQAALDAVRQWEFTPTLLEGKPVNVIMTVTVNFRLQ